jgi:transposase-like protein
MVRCRREPTEGARRATVVGSRRTPIKEDTMSVSDNETTSGTQPPRRKRRRLSPEKKYQIFLETQSKDAPIGEILRREGLYSTDLARIRQQVKEGALDRLKQRPGARKKTIDLNQYLVLKKELEEKERVLAEMSVDLVILQKKTNGGSWER